MKESETLCERERDKERAFLHTLLSLSSFCSTFPSSLSYTHAHTHANIHTHTCAQAFSPTPEVSLIALPGVRPGGVGLRMSLTESVETYRSN